MSITSQLLRLRQHLKLQLDQNQRDRLAKLQALRFRLLQRIAYGLLFGSNLTMLAFVNKTDKWAGHDYTEHDHRHFRRLRRRRLNLLEIGIGGWKDPELGGGSLRMWRTYFPRARAYGIDVFSKTPHDERRIKTFMGSQVDEQ